MRVKIKHLLFFLLFVVLPCWLLFAVLARCVTDCRSFVASGQTYAELHRIATNDWESADDVRDYVDDRNMWQIEYSGQTCYMLDLEESTNKWVLRATPSKKAILEHGVLWSVLRLDFREYAFPTYVISNGSHEVREEP